MVYASEKNLIVVLLFSIANAILEVHNSGIHLFIIRVTFDMC